ncbi:MAG TPA: MarR family winged helix-turn-helix transcriptional regulator [Puia sp.]|nr:MarR family winged helix-turn-helix transcriptional regulator [Puia sp.]
MKESQVAEMRAFNRFYTSLVGVLGLKFLNGKFSLPELRVLHAIASVPGITANEVVTLLRIDKSYLSKIIIRFEKRKYLTKKMSSADGRVYHLRLTALGKKEFGVYDRLSDEYVRQILEQLPSEDCEVLMECMRRITGILSEVKL